MLRLKAYEEFRDRLLSGDLKPGQFVTQRELAKLIGVPLGAAREAIQRLEFESLLKVYPQRGVQVAQATARLIRTAYGFRLILEKEAVRQFAASAPLEDIEQLEDTTRQIVEKAAQSITDALQEEAVEVDWRMHDTLIDFLDNEIVSEAYRVNAARIRLIRGAGNRLPRNRLVPALTEHLEILAACKERDEEKAEALLAAHIQTSQQMTLDGS